jgi:16S rRNA (uracil1498-N3)-methyltransferase
MTEASEQCGRGNVPHYSESISIHDAVTTPTVVMCDSTGISATDYFREHTESCAILIGPEGGFTTEEMKLCEDAHVPVLSFGQQTLRADTAAIVAATFALLK